MLSLLTFLMSPFFLQDGMIIENPYLQQMSIEDETDENDDADVLLAYNGSENPTGRIMTISQDLSGKSDAEKKNCNQQIDADEDIEQDPNEEEEPEIQETSTQQTYQAIEKEIGDMRMIQLANSIAGDMGMVTKVVLAR